MLYEIECWILTNQQVNNVNAIDIKYCIRYVMRQEIFEIKIKILEYWGSIYTIEDLQNTRWWKIDLTSLNL